MHTAMPIHRAAMCQVLHVRCSARVGARSGLESDERSGVAVLIGAAYRAGGAASNADLWANAPLSRRARNAVTGPPTVRHVNIRHCVPAEPCTPFRLVVNGPGFPRAESCSRILSLPEPPVTDTVPNATRRAPALGF